MLQHWFTCSFALNKSQQGLFPKKFTKFFEGIHLVIDKFAIKFSNRFFKQVDDCVLGGLLSVTLSNIHTVKMVMLSKPIFCRRFVDDI